jgi:hypothetical protein
VTTLYGHHSAAKQRCVPKTSGSFCLEIRVKNTISRSEQSFYINKVSLSRLSPYYRAAFGSGFSESTKESFVMELSCDDMYLFAMWMCGGGLVYHGKHPGLGQLIRLYVFADYYDFPALRRTIMSLVKFDRYAFRDLIPYQLYATLSQLALTSPLYQWLATVWVVHVYDHVDDLSLEAHRLENNMPEDFRELVRSARSERRRLLVLCRCCHNLCNYHEHQSEYEWEISNVPWKTSWTRTTDPTLYTRCTK